LSWSICWVNLALQGLISTYKFSWPVSMQTLRISWENLLEDHFISSHYLSSCVTVIRKLTLGTHNTQPQRERYFWEFFIRCDTWFYWPYFRPKNVIFHIHFQTCRPLKHMPVFWPEIMSSWLNSLEQSNKKLSLNPVWVHLILFFLIHLELKWQICSYTSIVPSRPKWRKSIPILRPKQQKNIDNYPLGRHIHVPTVYMACARESLPGYQLFLMAINLNGTIFANDYRARLAYVTTFDHPHVHNFHLWHPQRVVRLLWV